MVCPLFANDKYATCNAIAEPVTPSLREREHFCQSEDYADCPTLHRMLRLHRQLREDEYLEIYLPPSY
ncbi:MAG: hypothetical protein JWM53_3535 [bacterium]|nr:hypothetical protein [bacterium]